MIASFPCRDVTVSFTVPFDVEKRIAAFALRKNDLFLGQADAFFLRPDESQKGGRVKTFG
jgi:hypothetical protein